MAPDIFPALTQPSPAGFMHILYVGIMLPAAVLRRRLKATSKAPSEFNRSRYFRSAALGLAFLTGFSWLVACKEDLQLFPRAWPQWGALAAGLAAYAIAVGFMRPRWRRAVEQGHPVARIHALQTDADRTGWVLVSCLAGLGEEIAWRGVLFALLGGLTGDPWTAALLTAISFGLAHATQGWKSAGVIVIFGLGFQVLVWLASSLYVAMVVHIAYDLTAGFTYARLGRELGNAVEKQG